MKRYKIHPAIGFARVGKSDAGFFLAPERANGGPIELDDHGEVAFTGYKDATHLMRRQGARFRVYEYEEVAGQSTLLREITADDAKIEWRVRLVCGKAGGVRMDPGGMDADGAAIVLPGNEFRNQPPVGMTRADLVATVDLTATGKNSKPAALPQARLLQSDLYIGEARTDHAGRLVVLPGKGEAKTWTTPASQLVNFLNNPGWYDDIADGPVDAKLTFANGDVFDAAGAWVVTGPPDFAPNITAITTLYDVAVHAALGELAVVSYPMDVAPILERAASYHWVNDAADEHWQALRDFLADPAQLADPSPAAEALRRSVADSVFKGAAVLDDFRLTKRQIRALERWADGDFVPGADSARPALNEGEELDRAALERCVGGGFFPGIEAGLPLRATDIYSEPCRLTRGKFTDHDGTARQLEAGLLTSRMACPWQADFVECRLEWWPAQRPDVARFAADGTEVLQIWDKGIRIGNAANHRKNMVDHFARLGVIEPIVVGGKTVFAQKGRDPSL
jgi:hypothetical protein